MLSSSLLVNSVQRGGTWGGGHGELDEEDEALQNDQKTVQPALGACVTSPASHAAVPITRTCTRVHRSREGGDSRRNLSQSHANRGREEPLSTSRNAFLSRTRASRTVTRRDGQRAHVKWERPGWGDNYEVTRHQTWEVPHTTCCAIYREGERE